MKTINFNFNLKKMSESESIEIVKERFSFLKDELSAIKLQNKLEQLEVTDAVHQLFVSKIDMLEQSLTEKEQVINQLLKECSSRMQKKIVALKFQKS